MAVLASLLGATNAWADGTITARPPNQFGSAVTTIDQGEKVTFQNMDIVGHDVTSNQTGDDGTPLFRSALVDPGSSGPVEGTEYLTTGSYDFFCSVHPGHGGDPRGHLGGHARAAAEAGGRGGEDRCRGASTASSRAGSSS